jgi:uncharacterized protein YehS (DUF1456 family)
MVRYMYMINTTNILEEINFLFNEETTDEEVQDYIDDNTHPDQK